MPCTGRDEEEPNYDPESGTYRLVHGPGDERELSTVVVSGVADITGVPVEELELNEVVHPGALNHLFTDRDNGKPRAGGELVFSLEGCEVRVRGSGEIVLEP